MKSDAMSQCALLHVAALNFVTVLCTENSDKVECCNTVSPDQDLKDDAWLKATQIRPELSVQSSKAQDDAWSLQLSCTSKLGHKVSLIA